MMERIVPHDENELANRMAIDYDEDSRRLAAMKDETELLMTDLENSYYIDSKIKGLISALLDKQDAINAELEDNVEALRFRLEDMGVAV